MKHSIDDEMINPVYDAVTKNINFFVVDLHVMRDIRFELYIGLRDDTIVGLLIAEFE